MRSRITRAFFLVFVLISGCATDKPNVVGPENLISIWNQSSRHIKEVRMFDCQGSDVEGKVITGIIKRGMSASVKLPGPANCINLFAFDYDGEVVARQRQVSVPPDFKWVIR